MAIPVAPRPHRGFVYNIVGIVKQGGLRYMKITLFPPGVPIPIYLLSAPIEFFSVFVIRPLTLSVRLSANMVAGHFLLLPCSSWAPGPAVEVPIPLAAVSFALGTFMIAFEIFVGVLQAFIFTILTASYIAGAMAAEH